MKKSSKIIIILVVLILVAGVYFLKNGIPGTDKVNSAVDAAIENTIAETTPEAKEDDSISVVEKDSSQSPEVVKAETEKAEPRIPMEFTEWNEEELFGTGLPLMLDFGSASCGPCQMMKPDLIAFYDMSYGKVSVRYADVWADPSLTGGFPVSAVPTQFFFNADGTPYVPSEEMQRQARFQMYVLRDTEEHVLTAHVGIMTLDMMKAVFREMGVEL